MMSKWKLKKWMEKRDDEGKEMIVVVKMKKKGRGIVSKREEVIQAVNLLSEITRRASLFLVRVHATEKQKQNKHTQKLKKKNTEKHKERKENTNRVVF